MHRRSRSWFFVIGLFVTALAATVSAAEYRSFRVDRIKGKIRHVPKPRTAGPR